ncbi:hypothetical protein BJX61DRAFT_534730 [Aspergillus egyptiacus]|nr:hypothetical protein BJX61DRAFT_534730 [Aspergillus egyptiacus]
MVLNHLRPPILTSAQTPAGLKPRTSSSGPNEEDPNIADPRFSINRPCIYERRLPGNAYITAHIHRLQHGFYATPAVSDEDFDHVDFLAVSFVFHSPDTMNHRFKAATIRASLHSAEHEHFRSRHLHGRSSRLKNPIFLMHAPHLLYGTVSPETMQWSYTLAGSLGIAHLPLIASLSPAAGLNGRFKRYEMLRIQGSVRVRDGHQASQIVWTLEENTLQRSGLPREFTFAMLIAKPSAGSRVRLELEIEPVLQAWFGSYPLWWLQLLKRYRAVGRNGGRGVDLRGSAGQRFRPVVSRRGFNFAALVGCFEDYVDLSGRKISLNVVGGGLQDDTDGSMPLPLPTPNPAPMPMPVPVPMPYPDPGGQHAEGVPGFMPVGQERQREREPLRPWSRRARGTGYRQSQTRPSHFNATNLNPHRDDSFRRDRPPYSGGR